MRYNEYREFRHQQVHKLNSEGVSKEEISARLGIDTDLITKILKNEEYEGFEE